MKWEQDSAQRDVWVAGKDEWWFEVGDHDRIDLLPRRSDTSLVKTQRSRSDAIPERCGSDHGGEGGVMEAWVKRISGRNL